MAYFEYRGKSVYYGEYGQGTPLIFLHGNTASSKMFRKIQVHINRFSGEWEV